MHRIHIGSLQLQKGNGPEDQALQDLKELLFLPYVKLCTPPHLSLIQYPSVGRHIAVIGQAVEKTDAV